MNCHVIQYKLQANSARIEQRLIFVELTLIISPSRQAFLIFFVPLPAEDREQNKPRLKTLTRKSNEKVAMNIAKKRHIAAWVLLAIFVPILLLSSIHVHGSHTVTDEKCVECITHTCHGHIDQTEMSFDDCVLCQFLVLSFVTPAIITAIYIFNARKFYDAQQPCAVYGTRMGHIVTRGPPVR